MLSQNISPEVRIMLDESISSEVRRILVEKKLKHRKYKSTIKIEISDWGYFVVSDKIFYDFGTGYSLKEALLDYIQTIKVRLQNAIPHESKKLDKKLAMLHELATPLPSMRGDSFFD